MRPWSNSRARLAHRRVASLLAVLRRHVRTVRRTSLGRYPYPPSSDGVLSASPAAQRRS